MMALRSLSRLPKAIARMRCGEHGQTNVEYALVIAGVAVALIFGVLALGGKLSEESSAPLSVPGTLKPPSAQCDPNYAGACIPPKPPDLNCDDLQGRGVHLPVQVVGNDPHGLDPDGNGLGCD